MNIEAVNDAHALFKNGGYNGTIEDFQSLIATNDEALSDAHKLFTKGGYTGDIKQFSTLVGVKKKDKALGLDSESEEVVTTSVTEEVEQSTPSDFSNGKCPPGKIYNEKTGKCDELPSIEDVKSGLMQKPEYEAVESDIQEPVVPELKVEDKVDTKKVEEVKTKIKEEEERRSEYEERANEQELKIDTPISEETEEQRLRRLDSEGIWLENYLEVLESDVLGDKKVVAPGEMSQDKSQLIKDYTLGGKNQNLNSIPVYDELINEGLFSSTEEEVVPALQKLYGDWGFKFEESAYYLPEWASTEDAMLVTAPNGETILLKLDISGGQEEVNKLKKFLTENSTYDRKQKTVARMKEKQKSGELEMAYDDKVVEYENFKIQKKQNQLVDRTKSFKADNKNFQDQLKKEGEQQVASFEVKLKEDISNGVYKTQAEVDAAVAAFNASSQNYLQNKATAFNQQQEQVLEGINNDINDLPFITEDLENLGKKNLELLQQNGSFLGTTWNSFLRGLSNIYAGALDLSIDYAMEGAKQPSVIEGVTGVSIGMYLPEWYRELVVETITGEEMDGFDKDKAKKDLKKLLLPRVRGEAVVNALGAGESKEYLEDFQSTFLGGAWTGVVQSAPALIIGLAGGGAGVVAFGLQSIDFINQEIEGNPEFENMTENEKLIVKLPYAVIVGALERVGVKNLSKSTPFINGLVMKVLNKMPKKASYETFEKLVDSEIDNAISRGLIKVTSGGVAEFETGFIQEVVAEKALKATYNKIIGKEMFKDTELTLSGALYAGGQEAIGGFVMKTPQVVAQGLTKNNLGEKANIKQFQYLEAVLADEKMKSYFVSVIRQDVLSGKITKEQGDEQINGLNEAQSIMTQIPDGLSTENKKKSFDLIQEKESIQKEIAGKNESLVANKNNRIQEIDNELKEISEAKQNQDRMPDMPLTQSAIKSGEVVIPESVKDAGKKLSMVATKLTPEESSKAQEDLSTLIKELEGKGDKTSLRQAQELKQLSEYISNNTLTDAVQEQTTEEGVLRPEETKPTEQVELQEVGQPQQEVTAEVKEEALEGGGFVVQEITSDIEENIGVWKKIDINGETFDFYRLKNENKNVFVIEKEGVEVGRGELNDYDASFKGIYLDNVRINKKYRRKGLATKLYEFVEKETKDKLKPSPIKQSPEIQKFWEKKQTETPTTEVTEEVSEIFDKHPELASIGTKQQYSNYLDSIFPESKVKDIVYHGGNEGIEEFSKERLGEKTGADSAKMGFFFSSNKEVALTYIEKYRLVAIGELGVRVKEFNDKISELQKNYDIKNKEREELFDESKKLLNKILDYIKKLLNDGFITSSELYKTKLKEMHQAYKELDLARNKPVPKVETYFKPHLFWENYKTEYSIKEGKKLYSVLLNTKKTSTTNFNHDKVDGGRFYVDAINKAIKDGADGVVLEDVVDIGAYIFTSEIRNKETRKEETFASKDVTVDEKYTGTDYVVFETEQIHILGGEQDIKGFKDFTSKQPTTEVKEEVETQQSEDKKGLLKYEPVDIKDPFDKTKSIVKEKSRGVNEPYVMEVEGKEITFKRTDRLTGEPSSVSMDDGWPFVRLSDGRYSDGGTIMYDSWSDLIESSAGDSLSEFSKELTPEKELEVRNRSGVSEAGEFGESNHFHDKNTFKALAYRFITDKLGYSATKDMKRYGEEAVNLDKIKKESKVDSEIVEGLLKKAERLFNNGEIKTEKDLQKIFEDVKQTKEQVPSDRIDGKTTKEIKPKTQTLYHGTPSKIAGKLIPNLTPDDHVEGVSFFEDKELAEDYGNVVEVETSELNLIDANEMFFNESYQDLEGELLEPKELKEKLIENGYDGINYENLPMDGGGYGIRVFNLSKITPTTEVAEEIKIDKDAITTNTSVETNRIKELDVTAEDGQTFNLDGTTYEGGGLVVPVMSINTTQSEITPEKISEFVKENQDKIGDAGVVKVGIYKFPGSDQVSIDLNIVVPSENRDVALEFGKLAGQESLFDLGTFENVKTGSDGKNPVSFTAEQFKDIAKSLKDNKLPKVFKPTTEVVKPKRKVDIAIELLDKLKSDLNKPGTLQVSIFAGLEKKVASTAIDIVKKAIQAGDQLAQAIEKGYKYLKENGFKGSKKDFNDYIQADIDKANNLQELGNQLDEVNKQLEGKLPRAERSKLNKQKKVLEKKINEISSKEDVVEEPKKEPKKKKETYKEKLERKQKEEGIEVVNNTFLSKTKNAWKKLMLARKRLPKSVFAFKERKDAEIAASLYSVEKTVSDFNKAYKQETKKLSTDEEIKDFNDKIDAYLRGNTEVALPAEIKKVVNIMRNQIDYLSNELVNNGLVSAEDAAKIKNNIGEYLTRSYEIYDNINYKPDAQVREKAVNYLRGQLKPLAEQKAKKEGISVDEALDILVENEVEKMLDKEGKPDFAKGGKIGSKDLSILKEKKDIPIEIRALMGEYSDATQNYARTVLKLTLLVNNARFLNQVKEAGMGVYLFENKADAPKGFTTQIAAEGSDTMNPLNGLWTTPEIAADMQKQNQDLGKLTETYLKILGVTKWAKTIGSVMTHIKNVFGNLGFMAVNGHTDITELATAYKAVKNDLFPQAGRLTAKQKEVVRKRFKKYIQLGIVKQSAGIGEIRDMFNRKNYDDALVERLSSKENNLLTKAKNLFKKGVRKTEDLYQAEDDFFKIVGYENELSRYAKAVFGKNKSELTPEELSQIEQDVADIIKNTYPTYSRVPLSIQYLKRSPVIGNFVSFQAESYRTAFNTVALAFKELKSDNPEIRKIGGKRLGGTMTYISAKTAMLSMIGNAAGVGMSGVLGWLFNDEDEEEKEKDVRRVVAPWSKQSDLIILKASDGKVKYIDVSASDPHGGINKVLNAFLSGEDPIDAGAKGIAEIIEPFVGVDITTKALLEIEKNKNNYGKPIYNPTDNLEEQFRDVMAYMLKTMEPGTISSFKRLYNKDDKLGEFASMLTGFRMYDVDVVDQMGYKALDVKRKDTFYNIEKFQYDNDYKEGSEQEREKIYKKQNKKYKESWQELMDDYNTAIRLGADPYKTADKMKSMGKFPEDVWADVINGVIPDLQTKEMKVAAKQEIKDLKRYQKELDQGLAKDSLKEQAESTRKISKDIYEKYRFWIVEEKHKRLSETEADKIVDRAIEGGFTLGEVLNEEFNIKKAQSLNPGMTRKEAKELF